jgi:hypothetical protein
LDPIRENFYQSKIGILRWRVKLGRIDIINEISMMSTHFCVPREGNLDPTYPSVDIGTFIKTDWNSMYGDVKEMIPSDSPVPCGNEVDLRLFVDSDHSGEQFTRHPMTVFVIYLNMAPTV